MSNGIKARQNEDKCIAMLAAQRQLYNDAKKMNLVLILISIILPFILSFISLFTQDTYVDNSSYIVAIAALILSFIMDKYIDKQKELAASIQQQFDTYVYTMPWNYRLFGNNRNTNQEIAKYSKSILNNNKEKQKLYDWYVAENDNKSLLDGILSCQRENYAWDIGLRKRFKAASIITVVILSLIVLAVGIINSEKLLTVICHMAFIAPMLEWLLSTIKDIDKDIESLNALDELINNDSNKSMEDLQDIQKTIFEHRKECYIIPSYLYNIFKNNDEDEAHRTASL